MPHVADCISLLYGDYLVSVREAFADFHVRVTRPKGVRRWLRPQALFMCDSISAFKPLPLAQAFPMLEWGLNWCVSSHAHRYLMIHAAVVEKGGQAVLLPAPPGSGKSTLCAGLISRGWRLFSDEIALICLDSGAVIPHPRPVSLKNASIDIIRSFAPQSVFSAPVMDTIKGTVAHMRPPRESVFRMREAAMPAWVVFPRYEAGTVSRMSEISSARAFLRIADNAFNYSILGRAGFESVAHLVDRVKCYDFTYSILDDAIDAFDRLESLGNICAA